MTRSASPSSSACCQRRNYAERSAHASRGVTRRGAAGGDRMSGALDGRTCVITGGTFGIGRAVALALAREGASLVLVGRTAAHADDTVAAVRRAGARSAERLLGDLSSQQEV